MLTGSAVCQTSLFAEGGVAPPADRVVLVALPRIEAHLTYRLPHGMGGIAPGACVEVMVGRQQTQGYVDASKASMVP